MRELQLVIDAKSGYDALIFEYLTTDRKIMVDAAVRGEALTEEGANNFVFWVAGQDERSSHQFRDAMVEGQWQLAEAETGGRAKKAPVESFVQKGRRAE